MAESFDLERELAAGAQAPANAAADAMARPGADVAAQLDPSAAHLAPKVVGALKRAVKTLRAGEPAKASRVALKALDAAPDAAITNHIMALCLYDLGRLSTALHFYERAWKADPKNPDIYLNLGQTAWKLDMLDAAEKFYRLYMQLAPERTDAAINLGGVLRDQGKYAESIEILRSAIYANENSAFLWNALGATLLDSGDIDQAAVFYQEALRLKPDFARAHHNLAQVYDMAGDAAAAVTHFHQALKAPESPRDEVTMTHGLSLASLAAGDLETGWDLYTIRLNPLFSGATLYKIDAPRWDGADLAQIKGKTLLVIGEQGLGDEVLFLEMLSDVIEAVGPEGEVRVACERRLQPLIKRSFPSAVVGRHRTIAREGREIRAALELTEDGRVDLWTPMGQPARALRRTTDQFSGAPHFKADPERVADFAAQLTAMGPGLKAGLLWKSLMMTAKRLKSFSPFEAWKPVLALDGVTFINLQYGETADDLARARDEFGVDIRSVEGLDLKDDLDGVAALCAALDVVMGPMNATTNLAGAVGARTWLLHARPKTWTMLGETGLPWYARARSYSGESYRDFDTAIQAMAADLQTLSAKAA